MNKAIGIFDSGVGGLTVVKEIIRQLPGEDIVYFGDTARVPYGTKSARLVSRYAIQDAKFLMSCGIKLLVAACNTVSAIGWEDLKREVPVPVVGVIEPGCASAVKISKTGKIGVIGTEATISSGIYPEVMSRLDSTVEVMCKACPLLVPLVEEGWLDGEVTRLVVRRYLSGLSGKVDTLIPGCTHYPLLKLVLEQEMGKETVVVDSAGAVAECVKELLREKELLAPSDGGGRHRYFVSDDKRGFCKMARLFLGEEAIVVEEVDIEKY